MKQLPLSKLQSLFAAVSAAQTLYIPADDAAGQASFTVWQEGMTLTKKLNTVRSAKDLFFPQVENLVGFRVTRQSRSSCSACVPAMREALKFSTGSSLLNRRIPTMPPAAPAVPL